MSKNFFFNKVYAHWYISAGMEKLDGGDSYESHRSYIEG